MHILGRLSVIAAAMASGALTADGPTSRLQSVDVVGTALRVTYADGHVVSGQALTGATLSLRMTGTAGMQRVRLEEIIVDPADPAGDLLLYRMTVVASSKEASHDLCDADANGDRWAFPLKGQWDSEGRRLNQRGLTMVCAGGGAIGKCVRWGYKPWATTKSGVALAPYHAACVNMVRANYCGQHGTTRDGMTIEFDDTAGVNEPDAAAARRLALSFEAGWSATGAVCVAHPRVPANVSLDDLARTCPRLRERVGPENCVEGMARKGYYGSALIFERSQ